VAIRGRQSAGELGKLVRRTLAAMDPSQAVAGDATIGELIAANTARHRFHMIVLLWFAICAVVLAATGIYGVVAESIVARRQEIAIRMALGAPRIGVVRGMVSKTIQFAVLGEAIGMGAVAPVYQRVAGLFYGVAPYRAMVFVVVLGLVFGVAFWASFWPAWSAVDRDSIRVG